MRSIRMVSDEEGERIRAETDARKDALLRTLEGAKVTGLSFGGVGLSAMRLDGFVLEKDDKLFQVREFDKGMRDETMKVLKERWGIG